MKIQIPSRTVEIDRAKWVSHFGAATAAEIRAELRGAAEQWLDNYLDDIGVKP